MFTVDEPLPRLSSNRFSTPLWVSIAAVGMLVGDFCAYRFSLGPLLVNSVLLLLPASVLTLDWRRRRALLASVRGRDSQIASEFVMAFANDAADPRVVRAVHDTVQEYLRPIHPQFPISDTDPVAALLLENTIEAEQSLLHLIARRSGRSLEGAAQNPYFHKIHSVHDLTLFFNAQPRATAH